MTDTEVICGFMEARPTFAADPGTISDDCWWYSGPKRWGPIELDLDLLQEVEKRLTDEQWERYRGWFTQLSIPAPPVTSMEYFRLVCGAPAEQKVKALANVLRKTEGEL